MSSTRRLRGESGISLVEILVALGILSAVLIALGSLMFQVARHTRNSAVVGYRSAAVTTAADWARGLGWDSIDGAVGCSADSAGLMAYTRCTTVQAITSQSKEISVVISPTGLLVASPETVVVYRTVPRPTSPFNVN